MRLTPISAWIFHHCPLLTHPIEHIQLVVLSFAHSSRATLKKHFLILSEYFSLFRCSYSCFCFECRGRTTTHAPRAHLYSWPNLPYLSAQKKVMSDRYGHISPRAKKIKIVFLALLCFFGVTKYLSCVYLSEIFYQQQFLDFKFIDGHFSQSAKLPKLEAKHSGSSLDEMKSRLSFVSFFSKFSAWFNIHRERRDTQDFRTISFAGFLVGIARSARKSIGLLRVFFLFVSWDRKMVKKIAVSEWKEAQADCFWSNLAVVANGKAHVVLLSCCSKNKFPFESIPLTFHSFQLLLTRRFTLKIQNCSERVLYVVMATIFTFWPLIQINFRLLFALRVCTHSQASSLIEFDMKEKRREKEIISRNKIK